MTDKGVFLTARLDEIAGELEAVDPRLALALDRVSDQLESRTALFGIEEDITSRIEKAVKKAEPVFDKFSAYVDELNDLLDEASKKTYEDKSQKGKEALRQVKILIPIHNVLLNMKTDKLLNRLAKL
jgi:hypothetical protein